MGIKVWRAWPILAKCGQDRPELANPGQKRRKLVVIDARSIAPALIKKRPARSEARP